MEESKSNKIKISDKKEGEQSAQGLSQKMQKDSSFYEQVNEIAKENEEEKDEEQSESEEIQEEDDDIEVPEEA